MKKLFGFILMIVATVVHAGVDSDLNKFFERLNFTHNVSRPHAFQDQQGGYYSGGSIMIRGENENMTLFEVNPPNAAFGCSAIDLYAGAFSFINKEQFLALMNNIGKNSIAFGTQIALQTAAPQIKSVLDQLIGTIQDINGLNINSCHAAASMLGGVLPKTQATSSVLCESIGISKNRFSDHADAKQGCVYGKGHDRYNKNEHDDFKDLLGDEYNIAWKALNNAAMFQNDRKLGELFMSISGSVILKKQNKKHVTEYLMSLAKNDDIIGALVSGGRAYVYQCDQVGSDQCLNPSQVEINIPEESSILYKVRHYIQGLSKKVVMDDKIDESEKSFVNSTYFPILKIIAVETAFKEGNSPISADEIAEIVAYDLVLRYLTRVIDLTAQAATQLQSVQLTGEPFREFSDGINQTRKLIYQKRYGLFQQLNTTLAVIQRTSQIEKQLHDLFMNEDLW